MNARWPYWVLSLCVSAQTASAAVYRWTDAGGEVHYSQEPPPNRPYVEIQEKPGAAPMPAQDGSPDAATQDFLRQADDDQTREQQQKQQSADQRALAAQECAAARSRLQFLEERPPGRLAVRDASGELSRMTADEWEKRKSEARAQIGASCKP